MAEDEGIAQAIFVWVPGQVSVSVVEDGRVIVTANQEVVTMRPPSPLSVFRALVAHITRNGGLTESGRALMDSQPQNDAEPAQGIGGGF